MFSPFMQSPKSLRQCYKKNEQEKKREYDQHVKEVSMDPCHPWDVFLCTVTAKWTSFESSILADHNSPNTLSLSKERRVESWCVNET